MIEREELDLVFELGPQSEASFRMIQDVAERPDGELIISLLELSMMLESPGHEPEEARRILRERLGDRGGPRNRWLRTRETHTHPAPNPLPIPELLGSIDGVRRCLGGDNTCQVGIL